MKPSVAELIELELGTRVTSVLPYFRGDTGIIVSVDRGHIRDKYDVAWVHGRKLSRNIPMDILN